VHHSGGAKINNIDTELDIIISSIDDLNDILSKNLTVTQKIEINKKIPQNLIDDISWFGEQSKSWIINEHATWANYSIGNRSNLLNSFNQERV
jgi:predicted RecB family endonuclease